MSSLAGTYWMKCDDALSYSAPCLPEREFGRVRSVAIIHVSYLQTILANPELLTVWKTGIAAGKVVIIPQTAGSFDPGTPKELKGYGRRPMTNGPRTMQLQWQDAHYQAVKSFYESLETSTKWVPAFRTSSLLHICRYRAVFSCTAPVEDDLESEVVWRIAAKMEGRKLPLSVDASGLRILFGGAAPVTRARIFSRQFSTVFK